MKGLGIGLHVNTRDARVALDTILAADEAGVEMAWMICNQFAPDPLAVFAATVMRTERIGLGTAIMPIFPRHPLALAQEAAVIDALAPGRLRLGVGPSHAPTVRDVYRLDFTRPLEYLREYVTILNTIFRDGRVAFHGERLHAETELPVPLRAPIPVLISALRHNAFALAGELTDGAISWVTPLEHIRDVAVPALRQGAARVGRSTAPPVIVHLPVVVSTDADAVRAAASVQFARYPKLPFYSAMWVEAGFPEAARGELSERMIDAIVVHGDEAAVADRLRAMPSYGAAELIATPVVLPDDREAVTRTIRFLGQLASQP